MRILVATDQWFPDLRGGVARVAAESSRRLAGLGHDVVVLAPAAAGAPAVEHDCRLELRRVLPRSALPKTLTDPRSTQRHAASLPGRFDVVLAHTATVAAGLPRCRPGEPLVTVFHASAPLEARFLHERLRLGRARLSAYALEPYLRRLERAALARSARVLVLSEFSRSLLERLHPGAAGRALHVPGAVDTARFAPLDRDEARERLGLERGRPLLFTVRRLVPRMGLEELLGALRHLDREVALAIAGTGELDRALRHRRDELGLSGRVRLLGRVGDAELVDWYRAADLVVVPSLAYEGFGLVTAEALACGTPVVGTPIGATPELLGPLEPRLLAPGSDERSLARAIRAGLELSTPALRARCRAYAEERLSWERAAIAWERALELEPAGRAVPAPARSRARCLARRLAPHAPFDLYAARNGAVALRRETTAAAVRRSGAAALARRLDRNRRAGVLLYHNPDPGVLERHLDYLAERHAFVPYDAVVDAVRGGDWGELPPRALALTIDDGHAEIVRLAAVFERFGIRPTVFLCSQIVGTLRRFWFTLEGIETQALMDVPDEERLAVLERETGFTSTREYPELPRAALSRAELEQLAGRFDFQAHTRFHPVLPMCSDALAEREIAGSKRELEALTGGRCRHFAYPNGRFGERELELVRRAGFDSARTIETGWNEPGTDPYRLRVMGMPDDASVDLVAAQISGLPGTRRLMYLT